MSKADEKALESLHGQLANVLSEALRKEYVDPDTGETLPPPAALLNVARQFLKDNKIEALAVQDSPLARLSDLPVFDEDENVVPIKKTG